MTDRAKAIAHVSRLIERYRSSGAWWATHRIADLLREIAVMQSRGDDGERLARGWCFIERL